MDDGIEWIHTPPFCRPNNIEELVRRRKAISPRSEPFNLFVFADSQIHEMEPVEYLISSNNELSAVGVAANLNEIGDRPLTMQFGTLESQISRQIYVGSIVLVRSYSTKVSAWNKKPLRFAKRNAGYGDMFYRGRLFANTIAVDWAVLYKPKIERALGVVTVFEATKDAENRDDYFGRVFDQENNIETEVYNDQWPLYIKKELPVESAVILTWVKVEGPHARCFNDYAGKTLLPAGSSQLNLSKVKEVDGDYWLAWVDTNFKASRGI